jgi:glutamate racemase
MSQLLQAMKTDMVIGLFDSGVGGLSVLRQLETLWSSGGARFVYLGDTARCPYGDRPPEELRRFVAQNIGFLLGRGANQIVLACNTSAAVAGEFAKSMSPVPVHNLLEPLAHGIAGKYARIGVLATSSTVRSRSFTAAIETAWPQTKVFEIACPDLVPLVEKAQLDSPESRRVLAGYVSRLRALGVEACVLGCTHFPFLRGVLEEIAPDGLDIIDPAEFLAGSILGKQPGSQEAQSSTNKTSANGAARASTTSVTQYWVTGDRNKFVRAAAFCLGVSPQVLGPSVYHLALNKLEACGKSMPERATGCGAQAYVVAFSAS